MAWDYIGQQEDLFLCYAKHVTECNEIINKICAGETCIDLDDYMDESDLEYIKEGCLARGCNVNLSLN